MIMQGRFAFCSDLFLPSIVLLGKNIAAMISRDGDWAVSGPKDGKKKGDDASSPQKSQRPAGAANLVGHKQPVVASRHCPVLFRVPSKRQQQRGSSSSSEEDSDDSDDDEDENDPDSMPKYATLVALGDKRGFVTVWSTTNSRPLLKMQCSESKCTVTDISWGLVRRSSSRQVSNGGEGGGNDHDSLVMIVSLLDGYVVALHFDIPTEVGGQHILSSEKVRQIFRIRYGIPDFEPGSCYGFSPGRRRSPQKRIVDTGGPQFVENPLQITMEMEMEAANNDDDNESEENDGGGKQSPRREIAQKQQQAPLTTGNIKDKQTESTVLGKKRIRPVLLSATDGGDANAVTNDEDNAASGVAKRQKKSKKQQQTPPTCFKMPWTALHRLRRPRKE